MPKRNLSKKIIEAAHNGMNSGVDVALYVFFKKPYIELKPKDQMRWGKLRNKIIRRYVEETLN